MRGVVSKANNDKKQKAAKTKAQQMMRRSGTGRPSKIVPGIYRWFSFSGR